MPEPVKLKLQCPQCGGQHVDRGEWATTRVHRSHLCEHCGLIWRPYEYATIGVEAPMSERAVEAEGLRVLSESRRSLREAASRMDAQYNELAAELISVRLSKKFSTYDLVFGGWPCPDDELSEPDVKGSPTGHCVYAKTDRAHDHCLFCGLPEERK